uniref:Rhomboid domain-containing protein n=2 Tax=Macrostomum lignano TaxID=282301 RepID=A0A1I8HK38_9PLAT
LQSRHRGGRGYLGLLLLAAELTQTGPVPPVTLSFILGQAALYIGLVPSMDLSLSQVCISPVWVYYRRDYLRLLLGSFYHADDWHLYYNMVSFLWKGRTLERMMGSAYFLILIAVFAPLIGCVEVALAFAAEAGMGKSHYLSDCSVGFSGVIFALKVLTTYNLPPGVSYVMGFLPVHSRLAVWAELVIIQLVTPNASLLGHLAGILVGLAYVKGPLRLIMEPLCLGILGGNRTRFYRPWGWGWAGGSSSREERRADRSFQDEPPPPPPPTRRSNSATAVSDEELRQRRLARFGQTAVQ